MKCHSYRPKAANSDLLITEPNVGPLQHKASPTVDIAIDCRDLVSLLVDVSLPSELRYWFAVILCGIAEFLRNFAFGLNSNNIPHLYKYIKRKNVLSHINAQ